jgi:hypothetical protein
MAVGQLPKSVYRIYSEQWAIFYMLIIYCIDPSHEPLKVMFSTVFYELQEQVRFEVFTVVTEECRLMGCHAMWLL